MTSTPEPGDVSGEAMPDSDGAPGVSGIADPVLLGAHDLALAALREVTPAATIGDPAGYRVEPDGVVSLCFENQLAGYPGWFWTVSLARLGDEEPTVLEVELLPGDGALLAPDWVPWAERLADYQAAQAALAEQARAEEADADDVDDDLDDVDDLDAADFDEDGSPILHAGDVDGVDIDELDDDYEDVDEEDSGQDEDEYDAAEGADSDDVSDEDDSDDDDSDDDSDEDDPDEDEDDPDEDDPDEDDPDEDDPDEYDPAEGDDSDD